MHEYRQIIYRLQKGQTIRAIAREGLASRDKIKEIKQIAEREGWLFQEALLPDEKKLCSFFDKVFSPKQESKATVHAEIITSWLQQGIQARVIHQHLKDNYAFEGAYSSVQRFAKIIKDQDVRQLTVPLHFQPGEAAQVDFGKGPQLFDERTKAMEDSWFFVMTLCWSRHQYATFVTHQDIATWLNCHQNAFYWFGGVVNKIIIDNPKCAITTACYYDPQVQRSYEAFAQEYGFIISACPPRDPKKKGRVESGVKFIKRGFLPLRTFKSLQDANRQLQEWVLAAAGNRTHGSTFEQPLQQFTEIERLQLKPLPTTPPEIAVWQKVTPYKNCHVRYAKCYYSVPYQLYNKELWLKSTTTTVTIYYQYEIIAMHARLFKDGSYSTQNEHLPPKAKAFLEQDGNWCLQQGRAIGEATAFVIESLLTNPTKDLIRAAQGVIKLSNNYGTLRLELACKRAIYFSSVSYTSIKTILANGLDYHLADIVDITKNPNAVYQGEGSFQRQVIKKAMN
jgi:transposase